MDWWNDLTDWSASDEGWRVLSGAIIPFVAIVVAGVIAALIGRAAAKRVVALHDRESRNSAVAGVVSAARKASRWGALGHEERAYADHLAEDADVRLRLLPVSGAPLAADWVQHELADIKRNSSTFTSQADQSVAELRDRLLEWNARPGRAKKLFKADLERWKFDSPDPDAELIARQQDWNAGQQQRSADTDATPSRATPTTTSLRPAPQQSGAPAGATAPASSAPGSPAPWSSGATTATTTDQDATTPIDDVRGSSDNRTRPYGDRETVPLDGTPVRPQLGSPIASGRPGAGTAQNARNDLGTRGVDTSDSGEVDPTDRDHGDRSDDRPSAAPSVASPTSADAHVNRASASASGLDRSPASSTSSGARADEDEDGHEVASPYTQPISASELRRRASDDD